MSTHLVLTLIGRDRPGLVSAVSDIVAAGGGNWLDTSMASLAGHFAGVLLVDVPTARADALIAALRALETQGLRLLIETSVDPQTPAASPTLTLDLIGLDRPGLVRDISRVLAAHQVSIVELESGRTQASFSGAPMFKAHAKLRLPETLDSESLRDALEALADELMVDLTLEAA